MKILVAGGTGFVGSHIVAALLESMPEVTVRVLSRRAPTYNRWGPRVEHIQGNVTIGATLPVAVLDAEVVIDCVQFPGHPVENPAKGWTYRRVDGIGTKNLLEACERVGTRRFVYFSRAGASVESREPWLRAKWMAEETVRRSRMEHTILRPALIYGPEDRNLNRFITFNRRLPLIPLIGDGRRTVQPVSVFDVARIAVLSASKMEAANRTFELGGPQLLTINEVVHTVQRVTGKSRPLFHLPVGVAKIIAGILAMVPNPPLTPAAVDFAIRQNSVDAAPTESFFHIRFEDLESGLRRYLKPQS